MFEKNRKTALVRGSERSTRTKSGARHELIKQLCAGSIRSGLRYGGGSTISGVRHVFVGFSRKASPCKSTETKGVELDASKERRSGGTRTYFVQRDIAKQKDIIGQGVGGL